MTTAAGTRPQATDNATQQVDTRRITESDADYQRLHATTVRRLTASVRSLLADLRHGMPAQEAANAFARRHTDLLKSAYLAAHRAGAKDYYAAVSRTPQKWAARVQPSERVMTKRLLFYAAGSVLKMANEAVAAWHAEQMAKQGSQQMAKQMAEPATPLQQTFIGLTGRIALQGEITWSGLNDGYVDAGEIDPANPATVLWWDLGPVKTGHCADCPPIAAGSPYDRPGTPSGNELDATPGDGHTECGAACHCSLRYGLAPTAEQAQSVWQDAKAVPPPPPGSLHWPDVPRPAAAEVDAAQQKLLDDYRTQFDRWEAVRGDLPALPDLFGTEGVAGGWVTWEQLTPAQQSVLADVFSVLAQADATFGHPPLEESTAAYGAALADLEAFIAKVAARADHLDQFIQDLRAARQQDWEEMFGKGPIATYFWNLRQDWYDTLEWFISRTEPDQTQMAEAERGLTFGYPDQPRNHGKYAPSGWTRQSSGEGEGGGGGGRRGGSARSGSGGGRGRGGATGGTRASRAPKSAEEQTAARQPSPAAAKGEAARAKGRAEAMGTAGPRSGAKGTGIQAGNHLDHWGQQMPFSHNGVKPGEFEASRSTWKEFGTGINNSYVGTIGGRQYLIKTASEKTANYSPEHQARNEVAVRDGLKAMGMDRIQIGIPEEGLAPSSLVVHEVYHVVGADGKHYSVQSLERGTTKDNWERSNTQPFEAARRIGRETAGDVLDHAAVADYLLGVRDRNPGNLLVDHETGDVKLIDNGFAFKAGTKPEDDSFVRDALAYRHEGEANFTRRGGILYHVPIDRAVVRQALSHEADVLHALEHYHLSAGELKGVRARFALLRKVEHGSLFHRTKGGFVDFGDVVKRAGGYDTTDIW